MKQSDLVKGFKADKWCLTCNMILAWRNRMSYCANEKCK